MLIITQSTVFLLAIMKYFTSKFELLFFVVFDSLIPHIVIEHYVLDAHVAFAKTNVFREKQINLSLPYPYT